MDAATGKRLKDKGRSQRSTLSSNGRVRLVRRRWQGMGGGGVVPADAWLDAAEATVSLGTRELCGRMGIECKSFPRAAAALKHVGQLTVSVELLRQVVEGEGKAALEAADSGELKPGWEAKDGKTKTPAGREVSRTYLGADGFTAPLLTEAEKKKRREQVVAARAKRPKDKPKLPPLPRRKKGADQRYKEFKLVQFHDEDMSHRLVSVTKGDCNEMGRVMRRNGKRIDFAAAEERVGNVDGGPWIVNQIMAWHVLLSGLGLDIYHLGQQVNQGKRLTFGEGEGQAEAGKQWAAEMMHVAKHEGYDAFWEQLVKWRGAQRKGPKRDEADRLLNYVSQRMKMIHYDVFLKNGWRISSSTTESECGAVPDRVKGGGKRWDGDNAEAMMALEAMHQSNQWSDYWTTCAGLNN